jgi:hypothetical protein
VVVEVHQKINKMLQSLEDESVQQEVAQHNKMQVNKNE